MLIGLGAITKELVLACRQLGLQITETLAALVARTIINPKDHSFYAEAGSLEEADARVVVEESVKKLFSAQKSASVESLKLQASFEFACIESEVKLEQESNKRKENELKLIAQIAQDGHSSGVVFMDGHSSGWA